MKSFDPKVEEFAQNYKFLIGSILPRPIAVIGTVQENGKYNLAPFSFFTAVSSKPMVIAFSPAARGSDGALKDTPRNIFRTKEFTVNFVTEKTAEKINLTAKELSPEESEFEFAGLNAIDSELIKAPRLLESPIHYECVFKDVLSYGEGKGSGQIITGEVVKVHVAENLLYDGKIKTSEYNPVGRGAGNDWVRYSDVFQLERLQKAQIQK